MKTKLLLIFLFLLVFCDTNNETHYLKIIDTIPSSKYSINVHLIDRIDTADIVVYNKDTTFFIKIIEYKINKKTKITKIKLLMYSYYSEQYFMLTKINVIDNIHHIKCLIGNDFIYKNNKVLIIEK